LSLFSLDVFAALRVAVQAFCREENSQSNHPSKRKREGFDQVNSILLYIWPLTFVYVSNKRFLFHIHRRDAHLVSRIIQVVQETKVTISHLLWQIEL